MSEENVTTEVVESNTSETVTPVETSSAEVSSLDATPTNDNPAITTGSGATSAEAPAWTPSYEFTVKDKKLQMDDMLKPLIKSKDVEAKLKDLYEKAHGLDEVKTSRETYKERATVAEQKYQQTEQNLKLLGDVVKKQDFNTFFEVLNIPKEQILQYAIQELKFQQLPAEEQAAIEQRRQYEQQFQNTQQENQTLQQQMQNMVVQQARQELNFETSKPEVTSAAQAFDARVGKQGAFMSEVIKRGQYYEAVHKTSPPAQQLVQEVLQFVGMPSMDPQGHNAPQAFPSQGVVQNSQKPVIPAFNGSVSKSPVRKAPTSIQDLRDMRKQL